MKNKAAIRVKRIYHLKKNRISLEHALLVRTRSDDDLSVPFLQEADIYRDRISNTLN